MSSKKRVSVFARLGPAGPTSPDQAVPPPSHRRYSSDKHLDKAHHTHPLPLPPHSHPHPGTRDDSLRERKPSHQDYEEKHYRDIPPPPPPLPSSSRHRSHKHYHEEPEHLEYPEKPPRDVGGGRGEKRSSLTSPLPPPPPPAPRKSRDLADRLSPTGKDILSKPFMGGYEDKLSKINRSGSGGSSGNNEGGRGVGGGKGKRGTPPEGGAGSDGEAGELVEESRRKRNRPDKKVKLEGSGVDDVGRRPAKPHHLPERDRREKGGERHGWPEKQTPPSSSSSLAPLVEGGGEGEGGKEGRARGRGDEREGRRKREEEWPEPPRELTRKRKKDNSEGNSTPPPDANLKRARPLDISSKDQPSDTSALPPRDERHPRPAKESGESLERKRRYESSVGGSAPETDKEAPLPKKPRSGETTSSRKTSRADISSSSSMSAGTSMRKRTDHYKGRSESDHTGASESGESMKPPPKLDWSTISSLSLPRPKPSSTSAVQRFSPGAVFSRLGVSRALAGPSLFALVSSSVSKHLARVEETLSLETGNRLPEALLASPFGDSEFAMTGVSEIKTAKENCRVCVNIGPHRQALLASADFTLRRRLGKPAKGLLPPSPSSSTWSSENFATARDLYNSLGTKASGKPAYRLESSEVGSLLIPK